MFSQPDLHFLLCSRDLDVQRAQRIIGFFILITTVTYSLSPVERSPRHPHVLFFSFYIHILSPPWFYVLNMYWFDSQFHLLSPAVFAPLIYRTYQPYNPLRSLLQRVFLRSPSPVPPTLRPHSLSTQSQYSPHYSFLLFHTEAHAPSHLFPLPPLPHQPLIPHINRTGIPLIPVINNESKINEVGKFDDKPEIFNKHPSSPRTETVLVNREYSTLK